MLALYMIKGKVPKGSVYVDDEPGAKNKSF